MINHFDMVLSREEMKMVVAALSAHKWYVDEILEAQTLINTLKTELENYPREA